MTKVAVLGARGRMGSASVRAIDAADGLEVVAQVDIDDDLSAITPTTPSPPVTKCR